MLLLLLLLLGGTIQVGGFTPILHPLSHSFSLRAHFLSTAFESLVDERRANNDTAYDNLVWMDPATSQQSPLDAMLQTDGDFVQDATSCIEMPLYPLSATYLPAPNVNHTLYNVEPRNIQMARDCWHNNNDDGVGTGCFCAVLCASDTGRIASVGTVMRILNVEEQTVDGQLARLVLTCQAQEVVDIVGVINPEAATREQRLRRSSDYLRGWVLPRRQATTATNSINGNVPGVVKRLLEDYHSVRDMYLGGVGIRELPPFAKTKIADELPRWTMEKLQSSFWEAATDWQTLCYTIREGRQIALSADRNEFMVGCAIRKGGPLKLPIHMEELAPEDRRKIHDMEVQAQLDFVKLGLDPCLDFQAMLTLNRHQDRLELLARMVSRERQRLEEEALLPVAFDDDSVVQPRKGAWFEGDI